MPDFQKDLDQAFKTIVEKHEEEIWIIKPGENSNRGNGITVV
jgi:hypothetical protein